MNERLMRSRRLWIAAAVIGALVVGGFLARRALQNGAGTTAVPFGAILPLTGNLASLGEPKRNAFLLAQDDVNADGGIDGRRLDVRFEDNRGEPREGVSAFQKLMNLD